MSPPFVWDGVQSARAMRSGSEIEGLEVCDGRTTFAGVECLERISVVSPRSGCRHRFLQVFPLNE